MSMSGKSCPVCGMNSCRIAPDGNSGYCKRDGPWELLHDIPKGVVQGPSRHENLSPESLATGRSTYQDVGRYIFPSFEQWELGFLRERHPERELATWASIAKAFNDFLAKAGRNSAAVSQGEARSLVGLLTAISGGQREPPKNMDVKFRQLRELYVKAG